MTFFYGQSLEQNKKKLKCLLKYWNLDFYKIPTNGYHCYYLCVHVCAHVENNRIWKERLYHHPRELCTKLNNPSLFLKSRLIPD